MSRAASPLLDTPRFEALRVLGEGGSGIVYEARAREGDRGRVALKVLRAELAPSERERRRFLDEAERMKRVTHEGLVALLEAGVLPDGRPFLAMPLLDGEPLSQRIARGPVPVERALAWAKALASAVQALHEAGIIHRDIKPENVLVVGKSDVDAHPVLLDFGIARDRDDDPSTTTVEGRVRGTPAYMAPERFFGAAATVQSDVYELAVLVYVMLVGRLPWGSEKDVSDRLNPTSPREAGADVSPAISLAVLRALSTRPEKRPASVTAFAASLTTAASGNADATARTTADVAITKPSPVDPWRTTEVMTRTTDAPRARTTDHESHAAPRSWLAIGAAAVAIVGVAAFATARGRSGEGNAAAAAAMGTAATVVVVTDAAAPSASSAAPSVSVPPLPSGATPSVASAVAPVSTTVRGVGAARTAGVAAKAPPPLSASAPPASAASGTPVDRYFEDRR